MQTFLPYSDFWQSARVLDDKRLGKQRVETFQILNVLMGVDKFGEPKTHKGWVNHPATVMWRQYPHALAYYGWVICSTWIERGFKDSLSDKFYAVFMDEVPYCPVPEDGWEKPYWLGDSEFHLSHRSNLLRKDPVFYHEEFFGTPLDLPYVWFPETEEEYSLTTVR